MLVLQPRAAGGLIFRSLGVSLNEYTWPEMDAQYISTGSAIQWRQKNQAREYSLGIESVIACI